MSPSFPLYIERIRRAVLELASCRLSDHLVSLNLKREKAEGFKHRHSVLRRTWNLAVELRGRCSNWALRESMRTIAQER